MSDDHQSPAPEPVSTAAPKRPAAERKADQVYLQIRAEIEEGSLTPGERIPENWLVEHTGTSRTPVRDALRRLASDELVVLEPRQAPMVSPLSLSLVRDLFAFRRVVEAAALEEIALRSQTDATIQAEFSDLAETFRTLIEDADLQKFSESFRKAAARFDALIVTRCGNRFLRSSIEGLRPHTARLRTVAHADTARLRQSVEEHIDMCTATASGDPRFAGAACSQHLVHVERSILTSLLATDNPYGRRIDLRD